MKNPLVPGRYRKLVDDVHRILDEGHRQAQGAVNQISLETHYRIGERIAKEKLSETAGYGESVMEGMAKELKTDRSTLVRCVQFYEAYPKGVPDIPLSWSHVRLLVTIPSAKDRQYYIREAEKERWSRDMLAKAIAEDKVITVDPVDVTDRKPLKRPVSGPYIYKATVTKVVDGDTINATCKLGFFVNVEETFRFALVDAPAMDEDGGPEAFDYVREQLAKAKMVVIKTDRADKYRRFVAHVFYSLDEDNNPEKVFLTGRYLNSELYERGLARLY
jgi:endonuclease YncB( thermonuclease family)